MPWRSLSVRIPMASEDEPPEALLTNSDPVTWQRWAGGRASEGVRGGAVLLTPPRTILEKPAFNISLKHVHSASLT